MAVRKAGGGIERDSWLVHRALFPKNVPLDYIHVNHMTADAAALQAVYFAYPLMLPRSAARVREYVAAEPWWPKPGWLNNERGYAAERIPGMGLWRCWAAIPRSQPPKGRTRVTAVGFPGRSPATRCRAGTRRRWSRRARCPRDGRVRRGRDPVIESRYGKGGRSRSVLT